jgi:eukaryotic-like serine/threonine-protein kinase
MRPQVGQVINNKYRLLRLIGDGGMGSVYEARHEVLGTSVALKFLHADLAKRPGLVQRFLQEARVSAQITSPHVVRVTDVDQTPSGAFIVMEYLEGKTLQTLYEDLYKAGVQLSYTDALEYAMQMLEGVEAAHRSGVIHRDLKPDNVMITLDAQSKSGRTLLKLLDFGIAKLRISDENDRKLTKPGVIMGTPEYMAPEQAFSADAVDARADIFSLGVMIFEMLAGRRPVGGEDPHQIATAYLTSQIARLTDLAPSVPPELADAVHRSMAPLAGDRWPTVSAFRDAIEPFAAAARAPSAMPQGSSLSRPPSTTGAFAAASVAAVPAQPAQPVQPVPKTFPPDDDAPAPPSPPAAQAAAASDTPTVRDRVSRDPTPLGGFAPFKAEEASTADDGVPAPAAGLVPPTRSVAPLAEMASTALAMAIVTGAVPEASMRRPSGTAVAYEPGVMAAAGMPMGTAEPTQGSSRAPLPLVASAGGARAKASAKRPGPLSSLPAILLLATGVSAAVVGGVYLAHRSAKTDDHEDPPIAAPPSTTLRSDPPPDDPTSTAPPPTSQPSRPFRPSSPYKPRGSAAPVTPAPSSSGPPRNIPIIPSILPPMVIPSTFPFDFPFAAPPAPSPPPQRPPRGERPPSRNPGDPPRRPRPPPPDGPPPGGPYE